MTYSDRLYASYTFGSRINSGLRQAEESKELRAFQHELAKLLADVANTELQGNPIGDLLEEFKQYLLSRSTDCAKAHAFTTSSPRLEANFEKTFAEACDTISDFNRAGIKVFAIWSGCLNAEDFLTTKITHYAASSIQRISEHFDSKNHSSQTELLLTGLEAPLVIEAFPQLVARWIAEGVPIVAKAKPIG